MSSGTTRQCALARGGGAQLAVVVSLGFDLTLVSALDTHGPLRRDRGGVVGTAFVPRAGVRSSSSWPSRSMAAGARRQHVSSARELIAEKETKTQKAESENLVPSKAAQ